MGPAEPEAEPATWPLSLRSNRLVVGLRIAIVFTGFAALSIWAWDVGAPSLRWVVFSVVLFLIAVEVVLAITDPGARLTIKREPSARQS
jgi:hypothetical protein